ncbi:MAG: tripartite tricarboxylate transporter substrate binding protein [Eubacteriales bacterium]
MAKKIFFFISIAFFILGCVGISFSEEYPSHEIKLLVGHPAGGGTDIVGRKLASIMEKKLGVPVVVLNKPGAAGLVALKELVRSKPDGYKIQLSAAVLVNAPNFDKTAVSIDDIDVIAVINSDPGVLYVPADSPYKTLDEFFSEAKANPGKLRVAHAGVGGTSHLCILVWELLTGAKFEKVPFRGNAEVLPAVAGGHVHAGSAEGPAAKSLMEAGKLRSLGVSGVERLPIYPDVPTFKEQGYEIVIGSIRTLVAPPGLPSNVKTRLVEAVDKTMNSEEMKEFWRKTGLMPKYKRGEDAIDWLKEQEKLASKSYSKAGIEIK